MASREEEPDVDREIRIEKMKRELDDLSGGAMSIGGWENVSPNLEEAFLERACAFEKAEYDTYFNRLVRAGITMTPPAELDDASLGPKLEEVFGVLANMRCFFYETDHLSDRELYEWLWSDGLREETPDISRLGGAWHTTPIGAGTDEDTAIHLRYYASEGDRSDWQRDFPEDSLPPRCPLPYNRDRYLPRPDQRLD